MTIIAGFDEDSKGMTRHSLTIHRFTLVIVGTGQMTGNTAKIGLVVRSVDRVLRLILMTGGAEGIGRHGGSGLLGVDLVAINAVYSNSTMTTRLPFMQGAGMATPT